MRIAFVNQPFSALQYPLRSDSIGIWSFQVARRCAAEGPVSIYTRALPGSPTEECHEGVRVRRVHTGADLWLLRQLGRGQRLLGRTRDARRPLFASRLYHLAYILQVARDLRRERQEVAYVHNFSQFVPTLRAWNPGLRIVLAMHCEWLTQLDATWMQRRIAQADLVVSCSRFVTDRIRDRFPAFAGRCHTLYNGVDVKRFAPEGPREGSPRKRVLFVGRLSPEKGVHVLLEAFRRVAERHADVDLELIGPPHPAPREYIVDLSTDPLVRELAPLYHDGYADHLRSLVPADLVPRVHFVPSVPQEELAPRYREADVFVFPSVWDEPFGMPVIEALACGTPVVATRSGGIPEVVRDGETGLLVERNDPEGLANAILALLQSPERARALSAAGRRDVVKRFSWDAVAARLLERVASPEAPSRDAARTGDPAPCSRG